MLPIPPDITDLILAQWADGSTDPDLNSILPPEPVKLAVLVAAGITTAPPDWDGGISARDWCRTQADIQTEAKRVQELLHRLEPMTEERAKSGNLPEWVTYPWASMLLFDWSKSLADAVRDAKSFLGRKGLAST